MLLEIALIITALAAYDAVFRQGLRFTNIDGDAVARQEAKRQATERFPVAVAGGLFLLSGGLLFEVVGTLVAVVTATATYDSVARQAVAAYRAETPVARRRAKRQAMERFPVAVSGGLFLLGASPILVALPMVVPAYLTAKRMTDRRKATGRFL